MVGTSKAIGIVLFCFVLFKSIFFLEWRGKAVETDAFETVIQCPKTKFTPVSQAVSIVTTFFQLLSSLGALSNNYLFSMYLRPVFDF